jgi:hypothetical protein
MNTQQNKKDAGSIVAQIKQDRGGQSAALLVVDKLTKRVGLDLIPSSPKVIDVKARRNKRKLAINKEFTLATHNVRTLNDTVTPEYTVTHKIERIIAGCESNNISIVAIQEHRLKSTDPLNYVLHGDWTLVHTTSSHHNHGVAILYSKQIAPFIASMVWKSDRIIAAHLHGNPKMCVISAYAPTEGAAEIVKDRFYEDLRELITSISSHTFIIMAGDLNARLGKDSHLTNSRVIGSHCFYDETNDNGQRLIDLCEATELRPAHSHFMNRRSRLATYHDPNGRPFQLDHVAISMKWWKSLTSCRAYDLVFDIASDHKVVSAKFRLSLRAAKKSYNPRCKFMTNKLAIDQVRQDFDTEIKNRFEEIFIDDSAESKTVRLQKRSDALNQALEETCSKVLGKQPKTKHPSWVTNNTLQLMDEQGKAKAAYKRTQRDDDRRVWREIQTKVSTAYALDRSNYEETQLKALELADQKRECGTTWKIIDKLTKQPQVSAASKVIALDGKIPIDAKHRLSEWCKYFSALLNNKNTKYNPSNRPDPAPVDNPSISTCGISRGEVVEAIRSLKKGKAPGSDYAMTAEVLQDGGEFIIDQLTIICQRVYSELNVPSQWTSSLIIPLPKKGNLELMTNFRGISLMSIGAKVFNRILLNRIREPIDSKLRRNQAGFRVGRSCVQQIHILRRIMEGAGAQQIPLYITFIDFMKAFDSIDREMMFSILRHYGIPEKIVSAIRVLYDESTSRVFVEGEYSEAFRVTTGVLQGDVLAPFLFIIVIDYVSKQSASDFGYVTHKGTERNNPRPSRHTSSVAATGTERKINDLAFADDVALLENSAIRAQQQLDAYEANAGAVGLRLNIKKTEQMQLNQPPGMNAKKLVSNGQDIAVVNDFKYLGSQVGSNEKDVKSRIALAWLAFAKLKTILKAARPTVKFKMRLFNATCIPVLLYGCETWVLTEPLLKRLDVFARVCYRIMLNIRQADMHMTNTDLYRLADQRPIRETIRERQLKFIGHCLRMHKEEPANIYALYKSEIGTNRRGAPRRTYLEQTSRHVTGDKELTVNEVTKLAKDKLEWKHIVALNKPAR